MAIYNYKWPFVTITLKNVNNIWKHTVEYTEIGFKKMRKKPHYFCQKKFEQKKIKT